MTELMEGAPRLGGQNLLLQSCTNLKGSAARRFDRRRMTKRKEFRHQSHRAAICGQAPHFGKNALVFWRATIRHDLSHRADNSIWLGDECPKVL